jgi:hypothetical protein
MAFHHSIMLYDDGTMSDIYPKIYTQIDSLLAPKGGSKTTAIIYSLEPNHNNDEVLQHMIHNGIANAAYYNLHRSLTIIDSDSFYQLTDGDYSYSLANKLLSIVTFLLFCRSQELKERINFQSQLIFEQQLDSTLHSNNLMGESSNTTTMNENNNLSIEAICVYKKKIFEAYRLNEIMKLIVYHEKSIDYLRWSHKRLQQFNIIECIKNTLEEVLGEGSSKLFFATLKLIYKIDEKSIILDPDMFVEKLNKMVGRNAANAVNAKISQHLISEVL